MKAAGVFVIDGASFTEIEFIKTGIGTHGLYPSRDGTKLYVGQPRLAQSAAAARARAASPCSTSPRAGRGHVADAGRRQPRHGQRERRRQAAVALRPLRQRRLRLRHATGEVTSIPVGKSRTGSPCGRSPAATRSATPATCADRPLARAGRAPATTLGRVGTYGARSRPAEGGTALALAPSASSSATSGRARSTRCGSASRGRHGVAGRPPDNVLGVLSLFFWSLTLDREREVPHLHHARRQPRRRRHPRAARADHRPTRAARAAGSLVALGLFGAALLYGDGVITPAISVLGADRGSRGRHARRSTPCVVPITVAHPGRPLPIQQRGTGSVGAALRAGHAALVRDASRCWAPRDRAQRPRVLGALDPRHASRFFVEQRLPRLPACSAPWSSPSPAARRSTPTWATSARGRSASPGSRSCSRRCAQLLRPGRAPAHAARRPPRIRSSSWRRRGLLYPLVGARHRRRDHRLAGADLRRVLAHAAGGPARLLPARDDRAHLADGEGQIYVPEVNAALMVGCIALVLGFRLVEHARRGVRHRGDRHDGITSVLFYLVARPLGLAGVAALPLVALFLASICRSSARTSSSSPTAAGSRSRSAARVFALMTTWKRGRELLRRAVHAGAMPLELFLEDSRACRRRARERHGRVPDATTATARRRRSCTT